VSEVQTSRGFSKLAVEEISPILTSGVLLDVAASKGVAELEHGYAVSAEDLGGVPREAGRERRTWRRGAGAYRVRQILGRRREVSHRTGDGVALSYWLADRGVIAVGADNMAWDVPGLKDPELDCTLPGHLILLVRRGIYIIENLMLEELARREATHASSLSVLP
jgi:hypothetical protein